MRYEIDNTKSISECSSKLKNGDILFLKNGVYNEKVVVINKNITIIGESIDGVIIQNKDWFTKIMPDYNECNTFRTETFYVNGFNIIIENLTIKNNAVPSSKYGQALALYADADKLLFKNVKLISAQDTIFTAPLPPDLIIRHQGFLKEYKLSGKKNRQVYDSCTIIGDVDYIFGSAYALFINCTMINVNRNSLNQVMGYISAPSHEENDKFGYLFYKCNLTAEEGTNNVYLSRPWRDYGQAAFIECNIGSHINKEGFHRWVSGRENTARYYEYSENVNLDDRVKWSHMLTKNEAKKYVKDFLEFIDYNI